MNSFNNCLVKGKTRAEIESKLKRKILGKAVPDLESGLAELAAKPAKRLAIELCKRFC